MNIPGIRSAALLVILLFLITASPAAAGGTGGPQKTASCAADITSCISALFATAGTGTTGPVSDTYVAPAGVTPVVVLQGSPYEMGYQYGLQVPGYIALVRDAAWASALSRNTPEEIRDNCTIARQYIDSELTGFDFPAFFRGMSDAMNAQGVAFTPDDPVVMLYYGGRQGPAPDEHCTAFVAYGNMTGGTTIAGENFDYYQVPSNTYAVILALYPDTGHAAIVPSGAGRTGSNTAVNDAGLVYIMSSGPSQGTGDTGSGITGFLEIPYVAMTAGSIPEAERFLLNSTRAFALNHLLADKTGNAEVIEATRSRTAIRYPADTGGDGYIIATNHYLDARMKPSQKTWDPLGYYPSSYYRYITAEKKLKDNAGHVSYATVQETLSLTDWWDGTAWHVNDAFSTNTINRFRPDVATLYSFIAVPGDDVVSVCTGNPGITTWGARAPGQTGTYVNYTVGLNPSAMVYQLRADADAAQWNAVRILGKSPGLEIKELYTESQNAYWEGVWWQDHAVIEKERTEKAVAFGKAATHFSESIALSEQVRALSAGNKTA